MWRLLRALSIHQNLCKNSNIHQSSDPSKINPAHTKRLVQICIYASKVASKICCVCSTHCRKVMESLAIRTPDSTLANTLSLLLEESKMSSEVAVIALSFVSETLIRIARSDLDENDLQVSKGGNIVLLVELMCILHLFVFYRNV